MMPTFPSPSLKFRTAGFPQYGFKASLSDRACPPASVVKPAPGMPTSADGLLRPFARFRPSSSGLALCPVQGRASAGRCAGGSPPPTPGVLGSGPSSVVSVPPRYYDPIRRSRRHAATSRLWPLIRRAFAVRERLGDPRDLPYFPRPAFSACRRSYAGGSARTSRCAGRAMPGFLGLRASRHPQDPSLPAIPDGVVLSTLHRSHPAAARAFARPSTLASEVPCHPRFHGDRHRAPKGVRLEGRTGHLPSSGLSPDQFMASK